jgi:cell division protein FtsB
MRFSRLVWLALLVGAAIFAVEGGEYGTSDLLRQRTRKAALGRRIDSLRREVDSLARYKRALLTDATLQERIAREEFGMVRGDKEVLYRFAPRRDTAGAAARSVEAGAAPAGVRRP